VDDVAFVTLLLDRLESSMNVDASRIVATGFSNGAIFLYELAAHAPLAGRFAAIAPVAGLPNRGFDRAPATKLKLFGLWGRRDPGVPGFWSPGAKSFGEAPAPDLNVAASGWYFVSAPTVARRWAAALGLPGVDAKYETSLDGEMGLSCVSSRTAAGEQGGPPAVVMCAWDGVHEWAGAGNGLHPATPKGPPLASRLLVNYLLKQLPAEGPIRTSSMRAPEDVLSPLSMVVPACGALMVAGSIGLTRRWCFSSRSGGYVQCP